MHPYRLLPRWQVEVQRGLMARIVEHDIHSFVRRGVKTYFVLQPNGLEQAPHGVDQGRAPWGMLCFWGLYVV